MKFGRQLKGCLGRYLAIGPFQIHSMSRVPAILQNGCQNIFSNAVSAIAMVLWHSVMFFIYFFLCSFSTPVAYVIVLGTIDVGY